ncbi:MAG: sugar ABC transporter ATP-binding protein [Dyella sp.]
MPYVLELTGISKRFPGVQALSGIDFALAAGEVHALLGENGAGKSTLMKILCGVYRPDEGRLLIDGEERHFHDYREATAAGVATIFQEFSLVPDLNAVENIFLGRELTRRGLLQKAAMRQRAMALFDKLGYAVPLDRPVGTLSVAQQQFVEIAKALSNDARILVLDEPTAPLTPEETQHLFKVMRELQAQGVAMVFISHHLDEIFEVAQRITVLRDGRKIGCVATDEVDMNRLVEMMVGRSLESSFPLRTPPPADAPLMLDVEAIQLQRGDPVNQLHVRAGEILGFAGVVGSGRSELALGLIGELKTARKQVRFDGKPVRLGDPAQALELGIGLLPENRKADGLILDASLRDNISLNNLAKYRRFGGLIDGAKEMAATLKSLADAHVKAPSPHTAVGTLSGGNQQKVVIARWLQQRCRLLIFDEPTRGIDVGAKAEIYQLIHAMAAAGHAVILISSELPEIVGLSHRVAVFRQGAITATLEGEAIHPNQIMLHATGAQHALS